MRVLIHVSGPVEELDLWPYVTRVDPLADGSLLSVEVVDGRDLVGVLVALTDRGLELTRVQTLEPPSERQDASVAPHEPDDIPGDVTG
jgi:hypothetical protein